MDHKLEDFRQIWKKYGVTICMDGWGFGARAAIVNAIAANVFSSCFRFDVATGDDVKNAGFLEEMMG